MPLRIFSTQLVSMQTHKIKFQYVYVYMCVFGFGHYDHHLTTDIGVSASPSLRGLPKYEW